MADPNFDALFEDDITGGSPADPIDDLFEDNTQQQPVQQSEGLFAAPVLNRFAVPEDDTDPADGLFEHKGGILADTADAAVALTFNVAGGIIQGAAREAGSQLNIIGGETPDFVEGLTENLSDEQTLSAQVGSGLGQGLTRMGVIGAFSAAGAKIGAVGGVPGMIAGGVVGGSVGFLATIIQGVRTQLNEVEDRVKAESTAEGAELEAQIDEARDKALLPVLAGQGLDSTLALITGGAAGGIRKGIIAATTQGVKAGAKEGVKAGAKKGLQAGTEAINAAVEAGLKKEALKQIRRTGGIASILARHASTRVASSAGQEAAGEFIETVGTDAAVESTITDKGFFEAAADAATSPEARRAALVGGIVGGTFRAGGEIVGNDRKANLERERLGLDILAETLAGRADVELQEANALRERVRALAQAAAHLEDPTNDTTELEIPAEVATGEELLDIVNAELTGIDDFAVEVGETTSVLKLKEERLAEIQEQAEIIKKSDKAERQVKKQKQAIERILARAGEPKRRTGQPPGTQVFKDRGEREVIDAAIETEERLLKLQETRAALAEVEEQLGVADIGKSARDDIVQEAEGLQASVQQSREDALRHAEILMHRNSMREIEQEQKEAAVSGRIIEAQEARVADERANPPHVYERLTLDQKADAIKTSDKLSRQALAINDVVNSYKQQLAEAPDSGALRTSLEFRLAESQEKLEVIRAEKRAVDTANGLVGVTPEQRAAVVKADRDAKRQVIKEEELLLDPDTDYRSDEQIEREIQVATSTTNVNNLKPKNALSYYGTKTLELFNLDKDSPRQKIVHSRNLHKAEMAAIDRNMRITQALLDKTVKRELGIKGIPISPESRKAQQELLFDIGQFLKGDLLLASLPDSVQGHALEMRTTIDKLSNQLMQSGAVQGDLAFVFEEGMGTYLNRSYQKFTNPKWVDQIDQRMVDNVLSLLRSTDEFARKPNESREDWDARLMNQVDYLMHVNAQSPLHVVSQQGIDRKLLSVLRQRKEIPAEIRALWGEKTNALTMYSDSILKMSQLLTSHKHLTNVRRIGIGDFLFDPKDKLHDSAKLGYNTPIAADQSHALSPLNGLRTSDEIYKALNAQYSPKEYPKWARVLFAVNGFGKYGKTVLSPITQARNFLSNFFILARNGNLSAAGFSSIPGSMRIAFGEALPSYLFDIETESGLQAQNEHLDLIRRGVIDEAVTFGEFRDSFRDAFGSDPTFHKYAESETTSAVGTVKDVSRAAIAAGEAFATGVYRGSDAFAKSVGFYSELAKYRKAFPEWTEEQHRDKAAEIVRATMPTYSLVPEIIKLNRQNPFVGPFVSFASETIRNEINTGKLVLSELSDPRTRRIGVKRAMSWVATSGTRLMLTGFGRLITGTDKEEEEAIRTLAAPWDKNSSLVFLGQDENNNVRFYNISHTLPDSQLSDPLIALNRDMSDQDRILMGLEEFFNPFVSEELLMSKLLDVSRGITKEGTEVWDINDNLGDKIWKSVAHVAEGISPSGLTSLHKLYLASAGEPKKSGVPVNFSDEMFANLSGQRITTLDPKKSLSFRSQDFKDKIQAATGNFRSTITNPQTISDDTIREAFSTLQDSRNAAFEVFTKEYFAAIKLGMSVDDINGMLKDNGVGAKNITAVRKRGSAQYVLSANIIKNIQKVPGRMDQISRALGDDFIRIFPRKKSKKSLFDTTGNF